MLKIIEPHCHEFYQSRIDTLLDLFKVYQHIKLSLEEEVKTTFITAEDEKCGVYGGALLFKKKVSTLDDRINKIISVLQSNKRKVWSVNLCLCVEEDETLSSLDQLKLSQTFYPSLFKKFMSFGKKEEADFFVVSLRPAEFVKTKTYDHWPFLLEILPNESTDGLFHGLLALKSERAYKKVKQTIYPVSPAGRDTLGRDTL